METIYLAKRLKELRGIRGMSQEYFANEARVSLRTIQRIENNESKPTGDTVKRIALALDVELAELIGSNLIKERSDFKATIIYLKKQLSKTNKKSEIKTFESFIKLLQRLKEKGLSTEQMEEVESYIQYLELEKIPLSSNEIFKQKLNEFKKYLKGKLRLVPKNYYTTWASCFALSFAIGFNVQQNIDFSIKIGVVSAALILIGIGVIIDVRIKRQERSFSF